MSGVNNNLYGGAPEAGISIDTSHKFNLNDPLTVSHTAIRGQSNVDPNIQFSSATGAVNYTKSGNNISDSLYPPKLKNFNVGGMIPRDLSNNRQAYLYTITSYPAANPAPSTGGVYAIPSYRGAPGAPAVEVALTNNAFGLGIPRGGISPAIDNSLRSYDQIRPTSGSLILPAYNGNPTVYDPNVAYNLAASTMHQGGPSENYAVGKGRQNTKTAEAISGNIGKSINTGKNLGNWALLNNGNTTKLNLNDNPQSTMAGLSPLKTPPGTVAIVPASYIVTADGIPNNNVSAGIISGAKTTITTLSRPVAVGFVAIATSFKEGVVYPVSGGSGTGMTILIKKINPVSFIIEEFSIKDQGYGYVKGDAIKLLGPGLIPASIDGEVLSVTTSEQLPDDVVINKDGSPQLTKYSAAGELIARNGQISKPNSTDPYGTPALVIGYADVFSPAQSIDEPVQPAQGAPPGTATPIFTTSATQGPALYSSRLRKDTNVSHLINSGLFV